jgi:Fe-S cluster biosynthesis and repair protein YggX
MTDSRIEQFRKMAEADPGNELGHFSLGRAYLDIGRFKEGAESLRRVIELNDKNSKAYALLAFAQQGAGDRAGALVTLRKGYAVAHDRGDLMPRNEMAALMRELGEEPPATSSAAKEPQQTALNASGAAGQLTCRRCGQSKPQLPKPPFKGQLGEQVYASVCHDCWREWISMGTKVINELRLDFSRSEDSAMYDHHMKEFLNLG